LRGVDARWQHTPRPLTEVFLELRGEVVDHRLHRAGEIQSHDEIDALFLGHRGADATDGTRQGHDAEHEPDAAQRPWYVPQAGAPALGPAPEGSQGAEAQVRRAPIHAPRRPPEDPGNEQEA